MPGKIIELCEMVFYYLFAITISRNFKINIDSIVKNVLKDKIYSWKRTVFIKFNEPKKNFISFWKQKRSLQKNAIKLLEYSFLKSIF